MIENFFCKRMNLVSSFLRTVRFFLTADKTDFLQNISDLEIEDVIRVIIMENVGNVSFETARIRTKAALQRIFNSCDR